MASMSQKKSNVKQNYQDVTFSKKQGKLKCQVDFNVDGSPGEAVIFSAGQSNL